MVHRFFALASVTALAGGLVAPTAGCLGDPPIRPGATSDGGASPSGEGDAGEDAGDTDASVPSSDGSAATATCPTTLPIDATKYAYKPAATPTTSCTAAEIDDLATFNAAYKTATHADAKFSVTNTTCKACLYTLHTDATWGPIVEDAAGKLVLVNSAGCVEAKSGKLECGVAYHRFERCLEEACVGCTKPDPGPNGPYPPGYPALDACYKAAAKGACKSANAAITSDCADAISSCADLSTKFTFEAPARALCAGL